MMKVVFGSLLASALSLELTPDTWDDAVAGKTVFLKFFAPWCGHCKSMKPAWDQLMAEYANHASILVADVDCTAAGKPLCDQQGVQGFPTIKHGDPNNLEAYEGGRDADALKAFAKSSLGPKCSPDNLDLCDADKKKQIDAFLALSAEDLQAQIKEKEDAVAKAEADLQELLKGLQNQYEQGQKTKDTTIAEIKESGLGLMKSVLAHRKKAKSEL